ncbi:MAG: hypothetical protein ACFFB3_16565 [Candidatus Hodarchaeota archaeon]
MVMILYRTMWENKSNFTIILATLFALWTLFAEIYLILWEKRLWEPLEFLLEVVPLLEWKLLDIVHVLLWLIVLFFGIIAYSTAKEMFETPAGWWDLLAAILIITALLFLIFNEWVAALFLALSVLEVLYFYASVGKS